MTQVKRLKGYNKLRNTDCSRAGQSTIACTFTTNTYMEFYSCGQQFDRILPINSFRENIQIATNLKKKIKNHFLFSF